MDKEETNQGQNCQPESNDSDVTNEQWNQYILGLLEESKQRSDNTKFSVTMLVDHTGVVDAKISLPENVNEELKKWSCKLLNAISSGEVGPLILQGLTEMSKKGTSTEKEVVSEIMEIWIKKTSSEKPCVRPAEVLKK
jgi:hypothetical protein